MNHLKTNFCRNLVELEDLIKKYSEPSLPIIDFKRNQIYCNSMKNGYLGISISQSKILYDVNAAKSYLRTALLLFTGRIPILIGDYLHRWNIVWDRRKSLDRAIKLVEQTGREYQEFIKKVIKCYFAPHEDRFQVLSSKELFHQKHYMHVLQALERQYANDNMFKYHLEFLSEAYILNKGRTFKHRYLKHSIKYILEDIAIMLSPLNFGGENHRTLLHPVFGSRKLVCKLMNGLLERIQFSQEYQSVRKQIDWKESTRPILIDLVF